MACYTLDDVAKVSTHSRPKAAGRIIARPKKRQQFQLTAARRRLGPLPITTAKANKAVSTHSRPKAAGAEAAEKARAEAVSTHSRPKAAGRVYFCCRISARGFNSQPPEGGWI